MLDSIFFLSCEGIKEDDAHLAYGIYGRHYCLRNGSETATTGFCERKAQKFGYRKKELISPMRGLRSSDSFFVSSSTKTAYRTSTHLGLAKRKERVSEEASFDHGTRVVTGV